MLPIRLELHNFLAYRQPDPIIFDGLHLACLTGPNGAGKSSLLDGITWALWGKARARSDDDLIHQGETDMVVVLDFAQGTNLYRVARRRQKKSARAGTSMLELYVWDAVQERWQPITAPSIRETNDKIAELLHLDYDTFVHSAFLQQGHADAFTVKTPGQRKDILAEIMGLDQWKVYEERAKDELKRIDHNLNGLTFQLDSIAQEEAREPEMRRDLELAEYNLANAERDRAGVEARYNEVAGAQKEMMDAQQRLTATRHRIGQRQGDLVEIENELERHRSQHEHLSEVIADGETIREGYAQLQAAREADHELGQKLQTMSSIKDHLADVNSAIQARRADLEAQARVHHDRILAAERSAAEIEPLRADLANLQVEVEQLAAAEQRRDLLRGQIAELGEESAALHATNKALFSEMKILETRIEQLKQAQAVCPLCGQPLDDEHKARLLDELQTEGTARGDQYRTNQTRRKDITGLIEDYTQEAGQLDSDLRRLQPLRERAALLAASLETALSASDTAQSEQSEAGAIEALIDSGEYAHELRAQRDAIQSEIDALGYDSQAHTSAREVLTVYSDYDRRQRDLDTALNQVEDVESAIRNCEARHARWQAALHDEQAEETAITHEMDALRERVEEARRREEELRQCRTAERRAQEQVARAQQALAALESARRRKADLLQRQLDLSAEKGIYEELRSAFGKNGVPAMIIEAAIPELEEAANRLLARMSDGRMYVRLDTQRDLKTGGVAETLDILISDELGTRSYESYSGGEAFRVNFAIRVALSQLLARRAGAQLRTLFLDEGFGTQDEIGRQRLVEAINSVQDQFDLVLVITHIEDLRDAFPVQIAITKTPDGSRVRVG